MAVLDWFSKKRKQKFPPKQEKQEKQQSKAEQKETSPQNLVESVSGIAHQVLYSPHVTEKSSLLATQGKYVFTVFPRANAPQIRRAVEDIYHVHVAKVHMITVPPKKVRRGRHISKVTRMPRAIVTLRVGETLDVLPK